MSDVLTTPRAYLESLDGPGRAWLGEFLDYMKAEHPHAEPVMFRQRPMFKAGKSYVMFTVAKQHFSIHALNFDLIEALKQTLPKAGYGKGCVKVGFADEAAKPALKALIDEVMRLNRSGDAPPVDTVPERPYEQALAGAFPGVRAKWLPLYAALLAAAKARVPEFREYFPAINVLWKHDTTFAQVSATANAMRVECFSDAPHPERQPVKTIQISKNRVAHVVELTGESQFEDVLNWVSESYALTSKPRTQHSE